MIEAIDYRDAMSLLTSAVNIVTTAGESGRHGFTASAVCSVTDAPPTLLVCMNKASYSHQYFMENEVLAVNVLSADQQHLSQAFSSRMTAQERFAQGEWTELATGSPVLESALATFDCRLEQTQDIGTHTVFICRVVAIAKSDQDNSLVYFRRGYHQVRQRVVDKQRLIPSM